MKRNISGEIFHRLTVTGDDGGVRVTCLCICGNHVDVLRSNLRRGNTRSCGCLHRESSAARAAVRNLRHGMTNTRVWRIWDGIVDRTTRPRACGYPEYGAVGIGIHPQWLVFENFYRDIGAPPTDRHSLDRIKNHRGYVPGNVRWATAAEQARNRRNNRFVMVNGERMCLAEAARACGISKATASRRLARGEWIEVEEIDG
ncbi:hypothetical protein [Paraburkholderia caribensis]|uniref:hypothetical protein n=1 Tax=Paraburkholderia caribensis TaxID=75105 RepID=UPI001CB38FEE|nr:hypothetical protein [Paraburkholderia caribensis]CAG9256206.1 conserved hypothetical protein [Paraburkholderia caribensis]